MLHIPPEDVPRRARRWPWACAICVAPLVVAGLVARAEFGANDSHVPIAITASSTGKVIGVTTLAGSGLQRLYVADADTGERTEVYCGAEVPEARVSADGRWVIFIGSTGRFATTYLYEVGSKAAAAPVEPAALLKERFPACPPLSVDWLSDGRAVVALQAGAECVIVAYDPEARTAELLGSLPNCYEVSLFCPRRSERPEVMAFVATESEMGVSRLAEGGKFESLTASPLDGWGLASPDGKRVVVRDPSSSGGYKIVPTKLDTSGDPSVDAHGQADANCADWSPSGRLVAIGTDIIDPRTGSLSPDAKLSAELPSTEVKDVWFVDENRLLVLYGDSVYVADVTTGEKTVVFKPPLRLPTVSEGGASVRRFFWGLGL